MKINYTLLLPTLALLAIAPNPAFAERSDPFVDVTCISELDYVFIRTFHLPNTPVKGDNETSSQIRKSLAKRGIYTLDEFKKGSANCLLPLSELTFELKQAPESNGKCDEDDAHIEIKMNGKPVHTFIAFDGCQHMARQIAMTSDKKTEILDCAYPEDPLSPDNKKSEMSCQRIEISVPTETPQ